MDVIEKNEMVLTKAALLGGKAFTEDVSISCGVVKIRSLDIGERAFADTLMAKGMTTQTQVGKTPIVEATADITTRNNSAYEHYLMACGLSIEGGETWTTAEVSKLKITAMDQRELVQAIERISGVSEARDTARRFLSFLRGDNSDTPTPK